MTLQDFGVETISVAFGSSHLVIGCIDKALDTGWNYLYAHVVIGGVTIVKSWRDR